jgi:iron-sulfur cluster assembly accessory protein
MRYSLSIAMTIAMLAAGCSQSSLPQSTQPAPEAKAAPRSESLLLTQPRRQNRKVVALTDAAVAKFKTALEGHKANYIRLSVKNAEPTGFMYDLKFDETPLSDHDLVDSSHGFQLVVDARSSLFLEGATIGWEIQADGKAGFKFDNPNAVKP